MQVVRIRETGNALAITIPRPYLQELGWGLGLNLILEIVSPNCLQARAIHSIFTNQHTLPTPPGADNAARQS